MSKPLPRQSGPLPSIPTNAEGYARFGAYSELCGAAGGSHWVDGAGDAPQPPLSGPSTYPILGMAYSLAGRYEEAIATLQAAAHAAQP